MPSLNSYWITAILKWCIKRKTCSVVNLKSGGKFFSCERVWYLLPQEGTPYILFCLPLLFLFQCSHIPYRIFSFFTVLSVNNFTVCEPTVQTLSINKLLPWLAPLYRERSIWSYAVGNESEGWDVEFRAADCSTLEDVPVLCEFCGYYISDRTYHTIWLSVPRLGEIRLKWLGG